MSGFGAKLSPELEAQLIAEAEELRELDNELGLAWRSVQQEAYRAWAEHDASFDRKEKPVKKQKKE